MDYTQRMQVELRASSVRLHGRAYSLQKLELLSYNVSSLTWAQPLAEDPSQGSPGLWFIIIINLFACMRANPARTHPCAFSLPFALACMTGKMSYKQIKIETQKRANYNMFNYLFQNHSSSLLYSVPGNVPFAIWQGHFFLPCFIPSLGWRGGQGASTWGEVV